MDLLDKLQSAYRAAYDAKLQELVATLEGIMEEECAHVESKFSVSLDRQLKKGGGDVTLADVLKAFFAKNPKMLPKCSFVKETNVLVVDLFYEEKK